MIAVNRPCALGAVPLVAALALLAVAHRGFAQTAGTPAAAILSNGDFQVDADGDGVPDGWASPKGGVSYVRDGENRFLRLTSSTPDEMVITYRQVRVPKGVAALELTWKQRTAGLKVGTQSWFDARVMLQFKDAAGEKVAGGPPAPNTNKNSDGWSERGVKFLVPDGAVVLEIMPTLFRVTSGTFDLDDVALKATDPAPLVVAARAKAEADAAKRAQNVEKRQAAAAAKAGPDGELIPNGNFQAEGKGGVPDKWGRLKGDLSWQKEGDNRFLRLVSPAPGKTVLLYHPIDLPKGAKALDFKWSQRVANLKRGKEGHFDARILFQWLDAAGHKMEGAPPPAATQKNTDGWVDQSASFLVPDGAVALVLMPTLFQVESGTFDLDNLSLRPADPAALVAAAAAKAAEERAAVVEPEAPNKAKWPAELRTAGNKVVDADGKEVWLQGVNVDSLQWNPRGERVMRSAVVADGGLEGERPAAAGPGDVLVRQGRRARRTGARPTASWWTTSSPWRRTAAPT